MLAGASNAYWQSRQRLDPATRQQIDERYVLQQRGWVSEVTKSWVLTAMADFIVWMVGFHSFQRFDDGGKGWLSRSELKFALASMLGYKPSKVKTVLPPFASTKICVQAMKNDEFTCETCTAEATYGLAGGSEYSHAPLCRRARGRSGRHCYVPCLFGGTRCDVLHHMYVSYPT